MGIICSKSDLVCCDLSATQRLSDKSPIPITFAFCRYTKIKGQWRSFGVFLGAMIWGSAYSEKRFMFDLHFI